MKHPLITTLYITLLLSGCGGGGGGDSTPTSGSLTSTTVVDDDNDGISTSDEINLFSSDPDDPNDPVRYGQFDHDGDGTPNGADSDYNGTDDSDNDGLSNDWEYSQSLNPSQPEILVTEERFFSVVTPEYSWIKLQLKTPTGQPIAGTAFALSTDNPALLRAIYPVKGWVSDSDGVIEAPIIALGTGSSSLYLNAPGRDGDPIEIANIDSSLEAYTHSPADNTRTFSSIKNDSLPGTGNARSLLQSAAAWTPSTKTGNEWIELPVDTNTRVTALLVQGRADTANWVSKLKISYEIAPGHREYANDGTIFTANSDRNSLVRIPFNAPAGISSVRIHPNSWFLTPALRAGLEVIADNQTAAINTDSDNDGLSDLLESRIGSDANDNNSPRLHNPPASERQYSSLENNAAIGSDGADGRLDAAAWRPEPEDTTPWTSLRPPSGSKLVGVSLQGDTSTNRWISILKYTNNTVAGLAIPLLDAEPQFANNDASSIVNHWLPDNKSVQALRIEPLTWENGAGLRVGLWVIDTVSETNDNPLLSDADGDGLNTLQEHALGLDANNSDSDNDGLSDGDEVALGANPSANDSDQDGLDDRIEQLMGSDPNNNASPGVGNDQDPDQDGLTSAFEIAVLNTDPTLADTDNDGLSDLQEVQQTLTDPLDADSDDDTLTDYEESNLGSNANLTSSPVAYPTLDSDDDGLNNARERLAGTNPEERDSDSDGLIDGQEYSLNSNPMDPDSPVLNGYADSDGDGLSAAREYHDGSDPTDANDPLAFGSQDLDGDNLPNAADADYVQTGDQDGDGIANQLEYDTNSDPQDGDSPTLGGAFDVDNDGMANAVDADFVVLPEDDLDNDGLRDLDEYALGLNATDVHQPLTRGGEDLDIDSTLNTLDVDYDPLADEDGDGWDNEFEYRANTNPAIANVTADFIDPIITQQTSLDSVIKKYTLPDMGTSTPYYSHNPHSLASVTVSSREPIEAQRDTHSGFSSESISYTEVSGNGQIINDTPRRFRNLTLRNTGNNELTRILGTIYPFSKTILSSTVANAEVIEPNPLGYLQVDDLQTHNQSDGSQRVFDESVDDYLRLAVGNKLTLNHPGLWQSYIDYSTSSCSSDVCQSTTTASDSLARLLYQQKPITLALLEIANEHSRLSWQNRIALKSNDLSTHEHYQQARSLSLGLSAQSGIISDFSSQFDTGSLYSLTEAEDQGTVWTETGSTYTANVDAPNKILRLKLYSTQTPTALYAFSEAAATDLISVSFDGPTGEFVLELSDEQWSTGRLALALEDLDAEPLPAMLLQWGGTPTSWLDEPLPCAGGTGEACHD